MAAVIERLPCPRCSALSGTFHCKVLSNCTWRVCNSCSPKPGTNIVFNKEGHFFLSKES